MLTFTCPTCESRYAPTSVHSLVLALSKHEQCGHQGECFVARRKGQKNERVELDVVAIDTVFSDYDRDRNYYLRVPKVDDLGSRSGRIYGAWCEAKDHNGSMRIYSACINCGSISEITMIPISPNGVTSCYDCAGGRCGFIQRNVLEGWKECRDSPIVLDHRKFHGTFKI